jgi:hypothetical protein
MKKTFFLLLTVAAVTFGFTSCNKDMPDVYYDFGAYYPVGNYIMGSNGTKYTFSPQNYFQDWDLDLDLRYYIEFSFELADGVSLSESGPGVTIPILLNYVSSWSEGLPTIEKDQATHDDPLAGMLKINDKTFLNSAMNFILFDPAFFVFQKNATKEDEVATWNFDLEVDSKVIPGEKNDTINMRLKFFNNRADGEKIDYNRCVNSQTFFQQMGSYYPVIFDLENLYFDKTDDAGKNKTYIIKMAYKSYEWDEFSEVDETKVYEKSVTCEWTPAEPYVTNK